MPRKPNYKFERFERERAKAEKKAARLQARADKKAAVTGEGEAPGEISDDNSGVVSDDNSSEISADDSADDSGDNSGDNSGDTAAVDGDTPQE